MPIGVLETALLFLCWLFSSLHNQFFNSWISRLKAPYMSLILDRGATEKVIFVKSFLLLLKSRFFSNAREKSRDEGCWMLRLVERKIFMIQPLELIYLFQGEPHSRSPVTSTRPASVFVSLIERMCLRALSAQSLPIIISFCELRKRMQFE